MFVVVEGIEGSGKSTLVAGLGARLKAEKKNVVVTREPGGTQLGDAVRRIFLDRCLTVEPLAEAFLVNAARAQHIEEVIRPALAAGGIIVCDRFTDSTLAYQGYGRGMDLELLRALCDFAAGGVEPDVVLLVDLPVAAARARLRDRADAPDRIENEDDAFHERVRRGFLELARQPRHHVLDGSLAPERLLDEALLQL
ncbi:MAG TPA: dTMP kinase [Candidatus Cybelea sp.]